jgi:hypothetical protein
MVLCDGAGRVCDVQASGCCARAHARCGPASRVTAKTTADVLGEEECGAATAGAVRVAVGRGGGGGRLLLLVSVGLLPEGRCTLLHGCCWVLFGAVASAVAAWVAGWVGRGRVEVLAGAAAARVAG